MLQDWLWEICPRFKVEFKKFYTQEINFMEEILGIEHNFRILPNLPQGGKKGKNTIFITMFLPTTISNTAVERAFMDFGTIHLVRAGTYPGFQDIQNGKRHVRLTPFPNLMSKIPHEIILQGNNKAFGVFWDEREVHCRKCFMVNMLKTCCKDVQREGWG